MNFFTRAVKKTSLWRGLQKKLIDKSARENQDGIEYAAAPLRTAGVIDWEAYAAESGCREMGYDPAFHYVLTGEREGFGAKDFDAKFYARRYSDAAKASNKLEHYLAYGQRDGRYVTPDQVKTPVPIVPTDPRRPTVFVIDHEASRTGAPILGWNIAKQLRERYFVVSIVFKGGDLMEAFQETADVAIICPKIAKDRKPLMEKVMSAYRPAFAVVNSVECRSIAEDLIAYRVPYIVLVQEFGGFYGPNGLRQLYEGSAAMICAAKVIMDSSLDSNPTVPRSRVHLQPQGRSVIPTITREETRRKSASGKTDDIRAVLRPPGTKPRFIVTGLGTVDMRKGVDLFVSAATSVIRARPDLEIYFVWIGHRSKGEHDARFLFFIDQQIERAGCGDRIVILPPTADIDAVYEEADVLFLSSRLDPMPNVCIDAAMAETPVVCFENGTGFAEILQRHDDLKTLVVPYLDVGAVARVIEGLADDPARTRALGAKIGQVARETFDMSAYVALIEKLGRDAMAGRTPD